MPDCCEPDFALIQRLVKRPVSEIIKNVKSPSISVSYACRATTTRSSFSHRCRREDRTVTYAMAAFAGIVSAVQSRAKCNQCSSADGRRARAGRASRQRLCAQCHVLDPSARRTGLAHALWISRRRPRRVTKVDGKGTFQAARVAGERWQGGYRESEVAYVPLTTGGNDVAI